MPTKMPANNKQISSIGKEAIATLKNSNAAAIAKVKAIGYKVRVHFRREKSNSELVIVSSKVARDGKYTIKLNQSSPQISQSGGFALVTISKPGENGVFRGKSRCSKKDNFCRAVGTNIALERALRELEPSMADGFVWYSEMTPGELAPVKQPKTDRPEFAKFKKQSEKVTVNA